jgi:hypothetical protein
MFSEIRLKSELYRRPSLLVCGALGPGIDPFLGSRIRDILSFTVLYFVFGIDVGGRGEIIIFTSFFQRYTSIYELY